MEKKVEGRLQKELKEVCLVEQVFVKDSDLTVGKLIENEAKKLGKSIKIAGVKRFEVGDGLEKKCEITKFFEQTTKVVLTSSHYCGSIYNENYRSRMWRFIWIISCLIQK